MARSIFTLIKIIRFLRDREVNLSKKLLFFVPIIYLIIPFDVITDFFFPIGYLDDVAVFVLMWPIFRTLLSNYSGGSNINTGKKDKNKYKNIVDLNDNDYNVE
ncbi:MAG: YkvA family protein [Bacillota bacterium]